MKPWNLPVTPVTSMNLVTHQRSPNGIPTAHNLCDALFETVEDCPHVMGDAHPHVVRVVAEMNAISHRDSIFESDGTIFLGNPANGQHRLVSHAGLIGEDSDVEPHRRLCRHIINSPPLMSIVAPVMKDDSSEQRKATRLASS